MTEVVIRPADDADIAAIIELRRQWTQELEGHYPDSTFDERLAAWFARESASRITWLAHADGRAVGMVNLAIFERMPRPGQRRASGAISPTRSSSPPTEIRALARNCSVPYCATPTTTTLSVSC
jgi:hypothetical protein